METETVTVSKKALQEFRDYYLKVSKERQSWSRERQCLATLIDDRTKEIARLKEVAFNYELAMERAEERAAVLDEKLNKVCESKGVPNNSIGLIRSSRGGVYLPNSLKQLVDMITAENVRLNRLLSKQLDLPNGAELAKKNKLLEEEVGRLKEELSIKDRTISQLKGLDDQKTVNVFEEKVELELKVRNYRIYVKQLRDKNTSLLMKLTEMISENSDNIIKATPITDKTELSSTEAQQPVHEADPHLPTEEDDNGHSQASNERSVLSERQFQPQYKGDDLNLLKQKLDNKCKEVETLQQQVRTISSNLATTESNTEYQARNITALHQTNQELQQKIDALKHELETRDNEHAEIIQSMQMQVDKVNDERQTYEHLFEEQANEVQKGLDIEKMYKKRCEEKDKQIESLKGVIARSKPKTQGTSSSGAGATATAPVFPRYAGPKVNEPFMHTHWHSHQPGREILVSDSAAPISPVSPRGDDKRKPCASPDTPPHMFPQDIGSAFTMCANCGNKYPSHIFEDHLKDCSRK